MDDPFAKYVQQDTVAGHREITVAPTASLEVRGQSKNCLGILTLTPNSCESGSIVLSDTARSAVSRYGEFEPLGHIALGPAQHEVFRLAGWKDTAEARAAVAALHG